MSFSEFMQWIRNFFSSQPASNPNTSSPATTTQAEKPVTSASPPIPNTASNTPEDTATSSNPVEEETPNTPEPAEVPNTPEPPVPVEPEIITPPPLPETTPPVIVPPAAPPEPQDVSPTISSITTADSKVALNQEIIFQIITEPAEHYSGCSLDLSGAASASLVNAIDETTGQFSLRFDKASASDNETQLIKVSNAHSSAETAVTVSLMKLFWHNHPGRKNVCDETLFVNQCAIRMGTALELSGIKMSQDRRILRRCTTEYRAFKHHKDGLVKGHVLAAQELANWIKSQPSTFGSRSVVNSQEEILGRSGIIFFRDGWGATDHIDVWDGQSLVGGFPSYFDSDFKELWFWDVY